MCRCLRRAPIVTGKRASLVLLLCACLGASASWAAEPAARPPSRLDEGRLFTTAAQRARLNAIRAHTPRHPSGARQQRFALPERPAPKPDPEPPTVRLRGYVQRGSGPPVIWANGESTLGSGRLPEDVRIQGAAIAGAAVRITLPDGRTIRLKPGQIWDPDIGRVLEGYRR